MNKVQLLGATMFGLAAATALPQAAQAQRIDRIVVFGDSYADDGNAFQLGGINPRSTVIYTNGRFSDGIVYTDALGDLLNAEIDNFAIGGAQANGSNVNAALPGLGFEIASFLAGGNLGLPGVPNVFPSVSGTFDENDLVTFNIGGNDGRAYQLGGGTVAGAGAAAAPSIAGATAALQAVAGAGAQNISWIAGNTATLPEVQAAADPAGAAAVRTAFNDAYLGGVVPILSQLASQGIMVHYLNADLVGANIQNNLGAFGFTGLACPTFDLAAAAAGDTSSLACALDNNFAQQFVYYGDGVHLTSAGFSVLAAYVAAQLQAPLVMAGATDLAMEESQHMARTVKSRMAARAPRDGDYAEGLAFYVQGDGFVRTQSMSATTDELRMNGIGATAGVELGFGNGMVGLAARYGKPEGDFGPPRGNIQGDSLSGAAYGAFAIGPLFVEAHGGLGTGQFDITRGGVIPELDLFAETDINHFTLGGRLGYLANIAGARVGPVVGLDYVKVDADGYSESGDAALALAVQDIDYSSLKGQAGIEIRGDFAGYGIQVRPFLQAMVEQELDSDDRVFRFAQTASPTIVNSWAVPTDDSLYGRVAVGFGARLGSALDMNASFNTSIDRDYGDDTAAQVGFSLGF